MASLFKRKGKRNWYVEYTLADGSRARKSSGTEDKLAARRFANALEQDQWNLRSGFVDEAQIERRDQRARPVRVHIEEYLDDCRRIHMSPKNIRSKEMILQRFVASQRPATINGFMDRSVRAFLNTVEGSDRTKNFYRQQLISFVSWLVDNGRLAKNSIRVKPVKEVRVRHRRCLTLEEVRRLLCIVPVPCWYEMALFAGFRREELVRAEWGDLNIGSRLVSIRNHKGARVDEVPLIPRLISSLGKVPRSSKRIFPDPVTNKQRRRHFKAADIPLVDEHGRHADLHSLRMTLATFTKQLGVDPQVTQRLLRHRNINTTMDHYSDLSVLFRAEGEALEGVARLLDEPQTVRKVV